MAPDTGARSEFELIAALLSPLTDGDDRALDLTDDAAVLPQAEGKETVISTDTLVAGVHFLSDEPADVVARRLLRVNLSDIASMGAEPRAYFLNLSLPDDLADGWIESFANGLREDQDVFHVTLLGGDTTRTPGPLTMSVTMLGDLPAGSAVRRGTANESDLIYVSGSIGDAGLGLARLKDGGPADDPLVRRYQRPEPRVGLGISLRKNATAMADVSDGLLADAGHIAVASGLCAVIDEEKIPISTEAAKIVEAGRAKILDLAAAGDDYELVFAVSPGDIEAVEVEAEAAGVAISQVGMFRAGSGVVVKLADGAEIRPKKTGYQHF